MNIRGLFSRVSILFALGSTLILALNTTFIVLRLERSYRTITGQFLDSTLDIYKEEIIGNILLGSSEITESLLSEIAAKRNVSLSLTTGTRSYVTDGFAEGSSSAPYILNSGGRELGRLRIQLAPGVQAPSGMTEGLIALAVELTVIFLGFLFLRRLLGERLIDPIFDVVRHLKRDSLNALSLDSRALTEVQGLAQALKEMSATITDQAKSEALAKIAAQVSHDIRSPIAALDVVLSTSDGLSEDKRLLIRSSLARIKDIANDLLQKKKAHEISSPPSSTPTPCLLSSLIEPLTSEKRMQYKSLAGVQIEFNASEESYGAFSKVDPVEFSRILSNLINNSIESFDEDKGLVSLILKSQSDSVVIEIRDDGRGIPSEILAKLGKSNVSHGKRQGSGLGFFHAHQTVARWNGCIEVKSTPAVGTLVQIILPICERPAWFKAALEFRYGQKVVVVDDDPSIHQIWEDRLSSAASAGDASVMHFSTAREFVSWFSTLEQSSIDEIFVLCDYEFINEPVTGFDLISKLEIASRSALVTSHHEDHELLKECGANGIKLIPKSLAAFVPIRF